MKAIFSSELRARVDTGRDCLSFMIESLITNISLAEKASKADVLSLLQVKKANFSLYITNDTYMDCRCTKKNMKYFYLKGRHLFSVHHTVNVVAGVPKRHCRFIS